MVTNVKTAPLVCSQRLTMVIMAFFGKVFVYSARVNLSVAVICMVRSDFSPGNNATSESMETANTTAGFDVSSHQNTTMAPNKGGELDWDKTMISHLLAMYFYGYICTQVIGGWLSSRFGGRRVWAVAHLISSICTILTPVCARTHIYLAYTVRFVLGFVSGVSFPTVHSLMGRWVPPIERSRMVSISFSGPGIGVIATLAISGYLCVYGFDDGWGSIFYLCGCLNLIWVVVWLLLTADTPAQHKRITERERKYIEDSIGSGKGLVTDIRSVPWLKIVTSGPIWGIIIASFCSNYFVYLFLTSLPLFMKEALKFDIKQNGVLSSLPYVTQICGSMLTGYVADKLIHRRCFTVKTTRKIFQCTSLMGAAFFLIILVQMDESRRYIAVMLLCMANFIRSTFTAGYAVNHLDLAPKYAGLLFGLTNTTATIGGIIAPLIVGALTPNKSIEEWRTVFYLCAGVCAFGSISYIILGDGELQSWAKSNNDLEMEITVEGKYHKENGECNGNGLKERSEGEVDAETSLVNNV